MRRYWLYIIGAFLVAVGAILGWWLTHRGGPALSYEVELEQEFLPAALRGQCRALLVVLEVARPGPTGLRGAVEDYLGKAPPADLFSFLVQVQSRADSARFIAVGERFHGRLSEVPELIRRMTAAGEAPTEVGRSGPYTIYQAE